MAMAMSKSSSSTTCDVVGDGSYQNAIQPHHGKIVRQLLSETTRRTLWDKLNAMPSSDTWYGDIYEKAIYGPMVFRDADLNLQATVIDQHFPGYRILADLYLEKTPQDRGFPFHPGTARYVPYQQP